MAIPIWVSTNGDWDDTGSWSTGAVPAAADQVLFDGQSDVSVTSGLNQAAVRPDEIIFLEEYDGDVGTPGNPLVIFPKRVVHRGSGTLHLKGDPSPIDRVIIDSPNLLNAAQIDGNVYGLHVKRGRTTVVATALGMVNVTVVGALAHLTIEDSTVGGDDIDKLIVVEGTCDNGRDVGDELAVLGGRYRQTKRPLTSPIYIGGGVLSYEPTEVSTLPFVALMGGTLDTRKNGFGGSITVFIIGPGANYFDNPVVTFGSTYKIDLRELIP